MIFFKDISDAQEVRYFNWKEGQGDGNDNSAVILTGRNELGEWASAFSSLQSPRQHKNSMIETIS